MNTGITDLMRTELGLKALYLVELIQEGGQIGDLAVRRATIEVIRILEAEPASPLPTSGPPGCARGPCFSDCSLDGCPRCPDPRPVSPPVTPPSAGVYVSPHRMNALALVKKGNTGEGIAEIIEAAKDEMRHELGAKAPRASR